MTQVHKPKTNYKKIVPTHPQFLTAITDNGDTIAIGACLGLTMDDSRGSVDVYKKQVDIDIFEHDERLDDVLHDHIGMSLELSEDGNDIATTGKVLDNTTDMNSELFNLLTFSRGLNEAWFLSHSQRTKTSILPIHLGPIVHATSKNTNRYIHATTLDETRKVRVSNRNTLKEPVLTLATGDLSNKDITSMCMSDDGSKAVVVLHQRLEDLKDVPFDFQVLVFEFTKIWTIRDSFHIDADGSIVTYS